MHKCFENNHQTIFNLYKHFIFFPTTDMSDGKAPTQAGKFKPRKPAARRATAIRAPTSSSTSGNGRGQSKGRGRGAALKSPGSGKETSSGGGRDGGRGRGRGGRGRGRDGGRGRGRGRFAAPKGQVFFTGGQAAPVANDGKKSGIIAKPVTDAVVEGTVFMPGMGTSTSTRGTGSSAVGKTAQERMAASSLARSGEGEETIVGEMEEGAGIGDGKTKKSILESTSTRNDGMPSMFDDDEEAEVELSAAAYTYDSDSSTDGEPKRAAAILSQRKRRDGRSYVPLQPHRLPFPPTRKPGTNDLDYLYKSQMPSTRTNGRKKEDSEPTMNDPELRPPFLDLRTASAEQRKEEQLSWMVFKMPTRLPRLAPHCTISGRAMKGDPGSEDASGDMVMGGVDPGDTILPDHVASSSSSAMASSSSTPKAAAAAEQTATTTASGYDDTLKDAAPGKYGKIVVHKSGKAYFIIGGSDSKTPQVKMLLTEGLPCGFLQQAVAIDPGQASYVPLGEVKKTIVVTPDIESSFEK